MSHQAADQPMEGTVKIRIVWAVITSSKCLSNQALTTSKSFTSKAFEMLGLDIKKHDIRFVEDNWESPTLGAWGLGWEVWLDGSGSNAIYLFPASRWHSL